MNHNTQHALPWRPIAVAAIVLVLVAVVQVILLGTHVLNPFAAKPPPTTTATQAKPRTVDELLTTLHAAGRLTEPGVTPTTTGTLEFGLQTYDLRTSMPVDITVDLTKLRPTDVAMAPSGAVTVTLPSSMVTVNTGQINTTVAQNETGPYQPATKSPLAGTPELTQFTAAQSVVLQDIAKEDECLAGYWAGPVMQALARTIGVTLTVQAPPSC